MTVPQTLPIDLVPLVGTIMGTLIVLIPVTGLTARFALKPIVESIAKLRQSSNQNEAVGMLERRLALLEKEVQNLSGIRDDLGRLIDEMDFQRQLMSATNPKKEKE